MKTQRQWPRALSSCAVFALAAALSVAASAGPLPPNGPGSFPTSVPTVDKPTRSGGTPAIGSPAAAGAIVVTPSYTLTAYIKPEALPPQPWPANASVLPPGTFEVKSTPTEAVKAASDPAVAQGASSSDPPSAWVGTKGKGVGVEAFSVTPGSPWPTCLQLEYMAHLPGQGDTGWIQAPARIGTVGASRFVEGLAFRLAGACAYQYTLKYNCHLKGLGDQTMTSSPALCGTRGQGRPLEAFVLYITPSALQQPTTASTPGTSTVDFLVTMVDYAISPDNWLGQKGMGIQLTSVGVTPGPTAGAAPWPSCLKLKYMAHVSGVGDTGWYDAPNLIRGGLEGVAFQLDGTCASSYVVEYQCHLQGIGDVALMQGPSFCGTRGQGRRLEAVRVTVRKR